LNTERCYQKIMFQKSPKMDLIFDQLLNPPKIVRNPPDHRHIGMTTYYGIKFKKCVKFLGYALPSNTFNTEPLSGFQIRGA
jgi:hypothetical protein